MLRSTVLVEAMEMAVQLLATAVGVVVLPVWSVGISSPEDQISLKIVAKLLIL